MPTGCERLRACVPRFSSPAARFVLHVHNRWYNLFSPEGRHGLLANCCRLAACGDIEPGDKFFDYRGIPQMYLHVFTRSELSRIAAPPACAWSS